MEKEFFDGGFENPNITKEDVVNSLKHLADSDQSPTPKDFEKLFAWQEQEEKKCIDSLMLLKLNFEIAKIYLLSGLKDAAIDAFGQATDQAEQEGPEADEIYRTAYNEFEKLLGDLDAKENGLG